ncbi:MAG: phosphoadenosine phosphosulfate reductase family protein, partial [Verrucomicrobiota bacterium]
FKETYEVQGRLEEFFGTTIESLLPEQTPEEQGAELGANLWERKPDLCCTLRKVVPLQRKLEQLAVWMTGVRRQQSDTREKTRILELYHFDVLRDQYILKLNPMATWSREAVWDYMKI